MVVKVMEARAGEAAGELRVGGWVLGAARVEWQEEVRWLLVVVESALGWWHRRWIETWPNLPGALK